MSSLLFGKDRVLRRVLALLLAVLLMAALFASCKKKEAKTEENDPAAASASSENAPDEAETAEPEPSATPTYTSVMIGTVTGVSTFLNVRSGPGTNYESIGKAYAGDEFTVLLKFVDGGYWHKIEYGEVEGYVHSDYLEVRSELVEVTP